MIGVLLMIGWPKICIAICGVLIIIFTVCDGIRQKRSDAEKDAKTDSFQKENIRLIEDIKQQNITIDNNRTTEALLLMRPDLILETVNISLFSQKEDDRGSSCFLDSHTVIIKNYGKLTAENVDVKVSLYAPFKEKSYFSTVPPKEIPPEKIEAFPLVTGISDPNCSLEELGELRKKEENRPMRMRVGISYEWAGRKEVRHYEAYREPPTYDLRIQRISP